MDLKTYFENTKGSGILATAYKDGMMDAAVYARPHFLYEATMDGSDNAPPFDASQPSVYQPCLMHVYREGFRLQR